MNAETSVRVGTQSRGKRVLCADDNRMVRETLRVILERAGYAVQCAADGREAWQTIANEVEPFDLLVTDQDMPHMCGVELVRRLKEERNLPEVVVISGNLTPETIREYRRLGVDQLLEKPFLIATILDAVWRGCARGDLRQSSGPTVARTTG